MHVCIFLSFAKNRLIITGTASWAKYKKAIHQMKPKYLSKILVETCYALMHNSPTVYAKGFLILAKWGLQYDWCLHLGWKGVCAKLFPIVQCTPIWLKVRFTLKITDRSVFTCMRAHTHHARICVNLPPVDWIIITVNMQAHSKCPLMHCPIGCKSVRHWSVRTLVREV